MIQKEIPAGAFVNRVSFVGFFHMYGIHPVMVPWMFINLTESQREKIMNSEEVPMEELPAR